MLCLYTDCKDKNNCITKRVYDNCEVTETEVNNLIRNTENRIKMHGIDCKLTLRTTGCSLTIMYRRYPVLKINRNKSIIEIEETLEKNSNTIEEAVKFIESMTEDVNICGYIPAIITEDMVHREDTCICENTFIITDINTELKYGFKMFLNKTINEHADMYLTVEDFNRFERSIEKFKESYKYIGYGITNTLSDVINLTKFMKMKPDGSSVEGNKGIYYNKDTFDINYESPDDVLTSIFGRVGCEVGKAHTEDGRALLIPERLDAMCGVLNSDKIAVICTYDSQTIYAVGMSGAGIAEIVAMGITLNEKLNKHKWLSNNSTIREYSNEYDGIWVYDRIRSVIMTANEYVRIN